MNTEREKLIEIWLDSATERQYQFGFRNALLTAGSTILHNTSHTALELGKDILAFAPDGSLMAYQLKGNPGGRLTISQWHELQLQINTLVYQPVSHPAVKAGTVHRPVLVTNGEIHEDVYAAIASFNAHVKAVNPTAQPLETIARGQLLDMVMRSAATLWPVDLVLQRNILNVFASEGDDELPSDEFVDILRNILSGKYAETAIPSAHLVTAILASNWIAHGNHYELVKMYVLLAVTAICYQEQSARNREKDRRIIEEIVFDIRAHMRALILDLKEHFRRKPFVNRNALVESLYYHPRKKMLSGLVSTAVLDSEMVFDDDTADFLWDFICKTRHMAFLEWEGIVPFCLAEIWAQSNIQGTNAPDGYLAGILKTILESNDVEEPDIVQLPGPYYSLREVLEWKHRALLLTRTAIERDSHYRRSWFADALFFLLARRNYKHTCQILWPLLTKFVHVRTRLAEATHFGPAPSDEAMEEDKIINTEKQRTWDEVVEEAKSETVPLMPKQLLDRPVLTLLYCLFVPQRMDRDVILWLDRKFSRTWY